MGLPGKLLEAVKLIYSRPACRLNDFSYDKYWLDKRPDTLGKITPFQLARLKLILPRIEAHSCIADIGCGDGGVLFQLREAVPSSSFIAIDNSAVALDCISARGVSTLVLDLSSPDSATQVPAVDYALLFEILEHMSDPERFLLGLMKRVSRRIFISVPNTGYFAHRLRLLFGRFPLQWRLHPGEHLRFWTSSDMAWWLSELGLQECCSIRHYEGIPLLNRLWPSMFAMGMLIEIDCSRYSPSK